MNKYTDRQEAGIVLAEHLKQYRQMQDVIVLALPRGGVPVGYEVAKALSLPLDILIVRKLGVPNHEELAFGAIASGGAAVFNEDVVRDLTISKNEIDQIIEREKEEIKRREITYRGTRSFPDLAKKTVILVDDGIATGATMRAAIKLLRSQHVKKLVVAIPVAARDTCDDLMLEVEELICPSIQEYFYAVGAWYENFSQTSDEEVIFLLKKA
ncbi:MAG TPA: phosphoribosyltransferase [Gammaproteobacteria bacterium]|nr:phosphoribosyltransferase [Gammaproteobacteria bacterium]